MRAAGCGGGGGSVRRGRETVGGLRRDTSSISGAPRSLWLHRGVNEGHRPETDDNTGESAGNFVEEAAEARTR